LHSIADGTMFARILFSDLSAWANRQVRVNDTNPNNMQILYNPEISFLIIRQGDTVTGGQGDKILPFARILFSDLSAWANRQVRVNNTNPNNGQILYNPEISFLIIRQVDTVTGGQGDKILLFACILSFDEL
jgi:hypothetical protein